VVRRSGVKLVTPAAVVGKTPFGPVMPPWPLKSGWLAVRCEYSRRVRSHGLGQKSTVVEMPPTSQRAGVAPRVRRAHGEPGSERLGVVVEEVRADRALPLLCPFEAVGQRHSPHVPRRRVASVLVPEVADERERQRAQERSRARVEVPELEVVVRVDSERLRVPFDLLPDVQRVHEREPLAGPPVPEVTACACLVPLAEGLPAVHDPHLDLEPARREDLRPESEEVVRRGVRHEAVRVRPVLLR
jgi:hypothetical protein